MIINSYFVIQLANSRHFSVNLLCRLGTLSANKWGRCSMNNLIYICMIWLHIHCSEICIVVKNLSLSLPNKVKTKYVHL